MSKIIVLAGLLLCSASALAQSHTKAETVAVPDGKMVVPVSPVLPGEENLTARERVERDLLMPTRRNRAAALQAAEEAEETTAVHGPAVPEEAPAAAKPEAKPAAPVHRTTYHRPATTHRRTSTTARRRTSTVHRRTTARKTTTARKPVARRPGTTRRR